MMRWGWGLVLLALSLVGEVLAVALHPDEVQSFLRRTYFGMGPDKFKSLDEELQALEALGRQLGEPQALPAPGLSAGAKP